MLIQQIYTQKLHFYFSFCFIKRSFYLLILSDKEEDDYLRFEQRLVHRILWNFQRNIDNCSDKRKKKVILSVLQDFIVSYRDDIDIFVTKGNDYDFDQDSENQQYLDYPFLLSHDLKYPKFCLLNFFVKHLDVLGKQIEYMVS